MLRDLDRDYTSLPRLKIFRQKFLSAPQEYFLFSSSSCSQENKVGHRLEFSCAQENILRRSSPSRKCV